MRSLEARSLSVHVIEAVVVKCHWIKVRNCLAAPAGAGITQLYSAGLRAGKSEVRVPAGGWEFFLFTSRRALDPTQPSIQSVPGALSLGYSDRA
jgi:hypothetical protein